MRIARVMVMGLVLTVSGCGDDDGGNQADAPISNADAANPDSTTAVTIPDPGNGLADWGNGVLPGNPCCDAPGTAYVVGRADANPGYVQGDISLVNGDFFYVFRTGPALTEFSFTGGIDMEFMHLHDGTGLVFGAEVTPTVSQPFNGTWPVNPNTVYVLYLHSNSGGFF